MALREKLTQEDLDLLMVIEDPIWFGEFMRRTNNGETDKNLWPRGEPFKYRWYQKDFLSDQNEFILFTGGRAIGKCQPASSRVYTTEGYKKIGKLKDRYYFTVYTLSPEGTLEQRRAVCVQDKKSEVYTLTTESGFEIDATPNHPFLTPQGYVLQRDLSVGNTVAVATRLPWESNNRALQWHELRWLGYIFLNPHLRVSRPVKPRFRKQAAEIEHIADQFHTLWHLTENGEYTLVRKPGPFKHPVEHLFRQCGMQWYSDFGVRSVPDIIMAECLDNVTIFIEALFSQFAKLSRDKISIELSHKPLALDLQELLLRFAIESVIEKQGDKFILRLRDYRAVYRFWKAFTLPGVAVDIEALPLPPASEDASDHLRYERITSISLKSPELPTYAIHVYDYENYISEGIYVHNSIVLEDKIVFETVNTDKEFPVTPEEVLVTPNQSQMTPILDKLILRFTSSPFLKHFMHKINKQNGTLDFQVGKGRMHRLNARIAGGKGEQNMVGLHIPRIRMDEAQIFPLASFDQLMPTLNSWEPRTQVLIAGVPNGFRNSVLYLVDAKNAGYKKYHIPSHNNPFYTYQKDIDNQKNYGGENDGRYQNLVLGRHGEATYQVISRDDISIETYPFYSSRYASADKLRGKRYTDMLERPSLPATTVNTVFAIDTGFVDPTIIQVICQDRDGKWRTLLRYRLTRIEFDEQEQIINWLDDAYNPDRIAVDIGSGGGGAGIVHHLSNNLEYQHKGFKSRLIPIQFSENLIAGYDTEDEPVVQDAKSYAGTELARMIQQGQLIFSEVDNEGISQIERIAKQRTMGGRDKFFILNPRGVGASDDDHIFASYVVFVLSVREPILNTSKRKLGGASGTFTQ